MQPTTPAPDFLLGRIPIQARGLSFSHPVFNFPRHEILLLSTLSMKDVTIDAMPYVNREGRIFGTTCNIRMTFSSSLSYISDHDILTHSTSYNSFDEPKLGGNNFTFQTGKISTKDEKKGTKKTGGELVPSVLSIKQGVFYPCMFLFSFPFLYSFISLTCSYFTSCMTFKHLFLPCSSL